MSTKRHTRTCRHPLFLSAVFTLGIASVFTVLVASLAQAHGSPATAAAALRQEADELTFAQISPSQGDVAAGEPALEYTPGVVLVKLKAGAAEFLAQPGMAAMQAAGPDTVGVANLFQSYGVSAAEPLLSAAHAAGGYSSQVARGGDDALSRVYRLHLAPQLDAGQIAAALAADAIVEYAEPDYIARGVRTPNDPEFGAQWALAKIGAPAAWDLQTGSADVLIAVIDSGVDTIHPEFGNRLWENDDPLDGADNDLNGQVDDLHGWNVLANNNDLADPSGHGTQVSGVIGAAADNGVGVAGMCWNCKLMFVNALQASGAANYSDVAKAVQYAASNGAQVINLSLGGYADSAVLHDAIREAATTAVIVAGAGNDNSANAFYPAAYPEVLAVAGTDQNDQKAIFSNYGPWVDVAAPGTDIRTTALGGYATGSGTSLSSAVISGLAGLVKSQHPAWTPEQVKWQILNTAANIDAANLSRLGQLGSGRVDAGAALAVSPVAKAAVESYSIDGQANGRPAPGQSFQLVIAIQNQWLPAEDLQGALTSSDGYISITDSSGDFGTIAPASSGSNAADPFGITVSGSAPYNRQLTFTLNLSAAGGYSLALPFTIQMRSATETLANTQYLQDTTWTNDKTYVLAGSVIVGQGVTLTIQPGTTIKAAASKFIRIDGTLIADGTGEQPIIFANISITEPTWFGLRFTDTAEDTVYDNSGNYAGGNVLRHLVISEASTCVALGTRSVLIAYSTFRNCTAIDSSGGSPHIEYNTYSGADSSPGSRIDTAVILNGGQAVIRNNEFTMSYDGVTGSGSPRIESNKFHDILNNGIAVSGSPIISDNTILNTGTGIQAAAAGDILIEGNLVANNGSGVVLSGSTLGDRVRSNTVIYNRSNGISLSTSATNPIAIRHNNLFGNRDYDLSLAIGPAGSQNFTVDATNNFWNVPSASIAGRIRDCTFDENGCNTQSSVMGKAAFVPALTEPDQTAPAFLRSVTMDPNPVGNQNGTVTIDFSRPMSTGVIPSALFHDVRRGTSVPVSLLQGPSSMPRLIIDNLGRTWVARNRALLMYNMRQWSTYTVPGGESDYVTALYGASNGDVWAGVCCGDIAAVRLRGTSWTTYTQTVASPTPSLSRVYTIIEDVNGAIWFGTSAGVFRFDGTTWAHVASDGALGGVEVWQSARDGQGRIWLLTSNHTGQSTIKVFDGLNWTTYDSTVGLPNMYAGPMFADSRRRIWVNTTNGDSAWGPAVVSMFDGAWHFFGTGSSSGQLVNAVSAFGESSDGTIWMRAGGAYRAAVTYEDGRWNTRGDLLGTGVLQIDWHDNIWYGDTNGGLNTLLRGADYAFDDGHWVSSTRFQADFTFTPSVPPGQYAVEVPSALDSEGMPAYTTSATTFTVDFGAGVSLDPPSPPSVAAQTTGSLANLAANWTTAEADVDQYRYAIGTAPGARNIVGWTYLVSTSFVRNDLNLTQGQTYYVTVQAHNSSGIWSANGVSSGVTAGQSPTPVPTPSPTPTGAPFIQPGTGGTQTGQFGSLDLSLHVPPNAISEPIRLSMQSAATPPATGGLAILGQSFAINAEAAGGAPITQFATPLTLVIHYTDAAAAGMDESRLQVFYWSEAQQQWVDVPTIVDAQANTLTVYLDHLTLFAALEATARNPNLYLPQIRR